eukprot:scaffold176840_cov20-Prasinocladus_malaysianus.AAC.1
MCDILNSYRSTKQRPNASRHDDSERITRSARVSRIRTQRRRAGVSAARREKSSPPIESDGRDNARRAGYYRKRDGIHTALRMLLARSMVAWHSATYHNSRYMDKHMRIRKAAHGAMFRTGKKRSYYTLREACLLAYLAMFVLLSGRRGADTIQSV